MRAYSVGEYARAVAEASAAARAGIAEQLDAGMDLMVAATKSRTPVDTGRLRASWVRGGVEASGGEYSVTVSNDATNPEDGKKYASYVENGHWNKARTRWVPPEYMLMRSEAEAVGDMASRLDGMLAEACDGL